MKIQGQGHNENWPKFNQVIYISGPSISVAYRYRKSISIIELFVSIISIYIGSVLPKVFWVPVLRTSGSWNLPVRMEGSLVRNFNNYYVLLIHVFDGCSNRLDPWDHFNLVCCCLSPVLISDKRSCWKISQSLKPICLDVEMLVPLSKKKKKKIYQSVLQSCLSNFRAIGILEKA